MCVNTGRSLEAKVVTSPFMCCVLYRPTMQRSLFTEQESLHTDQSLTQPFWPSFAENRRNYFFSVFVFKLTQIQIEAHSLTSSSSNL